MNIDKDQGSPSRREVRTKRKNPVIELKELVKGRAHRVDPKVRLEIPMRGSIKIPKDNLEVINKLHGHT